jgi:endonuclease G
MGAHPAHLRNATVPDAFFMIIVDESGGRIRSEAFIFRQDTPPAARLDDALVSIDTIEERTGLDFFNELTPEVQSQLESRRADRVW